MFQLHFRLEPIPLNYGTDAERQEMRRQASLVVARCYRKARSTVQLLDRRLNGLSGTAAISIELALFFESIVDVVRHYPDESWEIEGVGGLEQRPVYPEDFPDLRSYMRSRPGEYVEVVVASYYLRIYPVTSDGVHSSRRNLGEDGIRFLPDSMPLSMPRFTSIGADHQESPAPAPAPKAPEPALPPIRESRRLSFKRKQ